MKPLIEIRGLRFRYEDGTEALRGVNFRLERGESVALLGPNGSGKTTFVLHLNGLLRGEGDVTICGMNATRENLPAIRDRVGMVFQESDNQLFMPTVLEDVCFGLLNRGVERSDATARARAALDAVGLLAAAERAPYHLSAGEKKRVAIAGILVMEPEILVLDEPTTYLDPPGQHSLTSLIAQLPQARILVTHDVSLAGALCNRAVFFHDGLITDEGPVEDIVSRAGWDLGFRRSNSRS